MFALLTALVARFGGTWLLDIQPDIMALSLQEMAHDSHCQAVSTFLRELLSKSLLECQEGKLTKDRPGKILLQDMFLSWIPAFPIVYISGK